MPFAIEPTANLQRQIRAVARERLDLAIAQLDRLDRKEPHEIEEAVHEARKRCKEVRALARLVRAPIGSEYGRFNALVRTAAGELSSTRDAHAIVVTLDDLRPTRSRADLSALDTVRAHQAATADRATRGIRVRGRRVRRVNELLVDARGRIRRWNIADDTEWLEAGIRATYRSGRRELRRAQRSPTDERMHEWRKTVKTLWYQMRLVQAAAPSALSSLIARLDDLTDALGDDHDLSVLVALLESDPDRFGGGKPVKRVIRLARAQQDELRRRAVRLGATLFIEPTAAFTDRVVSYWNNAVELGPELPTGGIAQLVADEQRGDRDVRPVATAPDHHIERERKFLVDAIPELPEDGIVLRQGYLAIDASVSARVRDAGPEGCSLTLKAGRGAVRTELEWPVTREQFETAWQHTRGRCVHKTRYRVPLCDAADATATAVLDVFHDELDGLVLVEVEFASDDEMRVFEPPNWFGPEVTDDETYTNAALAVGGWRSRSVP